MLVLLAFNVMMAISHVFTRKSLLTASGHFPGEGFVPLNPYLSKVPVAGYVTNYISSIHEQNRPAVFNYHQAKFALAPVILDRFKPWDHEYVVLYYFPSYDFAPIFVPWPYQVVAKFNNNTILIKSIHK